MYMYNMFILIYTYIYMYIHIFFSIYMHDICMYIHICQFGGQVVFQEDAVISRQELDGQRFALQDILLLSLCDEIITTQMSTFSYVAHALSDTVPYIVTLQGTCVKDISSQPCMHAWRHIAVAAACYNYELPFTSSPETRNCGYYTQQSLTAPKNCEWEH